MSRSMRTMLAAALTLGCSASDEAVVETDAGPVRGVVSGEVRSFQGIPYGAPPVGALRWRAPEPASPWSELRDATRPGPRCPQVATSYVEIASDTEDCLYLNVTTPRRADPHARRPVMVWIHGDGAIGGGDLFDARRLASEGDVVVVTINYRLGVFGGFSHPGLIGSGSFGLQDQQLALRWVQSNAAAFGGDPGNVTLFGVSYGASAITAQLTSPAAKGLFHRAILQSSEGMMDMLAGSLGPEVPFDPWMMWATREEQDALGLHVAAQLGCVAPATALECLRALPVARILEVPAVMHLFQAYVHGESVLPEVPGEALRSGRSAAMPVLAGHTRDEHRLFVGLFYDLAGAPVTAETYPALLAAAFGERAAEVAEEYPLATFDSPGVAWAQVLTDRMWARATFEQNTHLSTRGPTYFYEFAESSEHDLPIPGPLRSGALHNDDVAYLFGDGAELSPARRGLSGRMIGYWSNFARSGDPNGEGLAAWPRFTGEAPHVQALTAEEIAGTDHVAAHRLGFWASFP